MLVKIGNGQMINFGTQWEIHRSMYPGRNIDEDGAPLHLRFAVKELHYSTKQVFDAFARILDVVKPCCAVLPKVNEAKILTSLLISYNAQVTSDTEIKVRNTIDHMLNKLISISKAPDTDIYVLTSELLSDIMPLQEYKVVTNYRKLCHILDLNVRNGIFDNAFDENIKIFIMSVVDIIDEYGRDIMKYREYFNDPKFVEYEIDPNYKPKLKTALDALLAKPEFGSIKSLVEKYGDSNETSISFIKFGYILKYVFEKIPEEYEENRDSLLQNLDAYNNSFARAMMDIVGISNYLKQYPDLQSIPFDFAENGIRKSGNEIHCELAMLQQLIAKAIAENGGNPINPLDILTNYLGVSKLSCVQCFAVFDFVGLGQFVRGGHGIWFNPLWNIPNWEFSETDKTLLDHIMEYIQNPQQKLDEITVGDQAFFLMLGEQYKSYNMHNDALSVHGEDGYYCRQNATDVMPQDFIYECFSAMKSTSHVAVAAAPTTEEDADDNLPQDSLRQSSEMSVEQRSIDDPSQSSGYASRLQSPTEIYDATRQQNDPLDTTPIETHTATQQAVVSQADAVSNTITTNPVVALTVKNDSIVTDVAIHETGITIVSDTYNNDANHGCCIGCVII